MTGRTQHLEADERIRAWHEVAAHAALAPAYDDGDVLLPAVLRRLDRLAALEATVQHAKAEALREAAAEMRRILVEERRTLGGPADDWLLARADEIDKDEVTP